MSRRQFLKVSAAAGAGLAAAGLVGRVAYAAGSDTIKIGLVGCGGRGMADAKGCVNASPGVMLWALGDLFKDRIDTFRQGLKDLGEKGAVSDEHCFSGWDNCKKVIESGVDLVLLCEPPGFRPMHMKMVVEAGKHVFVEKPVAVDPVGVRSVIATSELAAQKKLAIVAGTQSRHHPPYLEAMKRIHGGDIGKLVAAQCYFITGTLWHRGRKPEWSEMEYQCRNWYYFTWLSGDHIVEQHVHNLDRMNWAFQSPPAKCIAVGGRQARTGPEWGNIYDHFGVEYEYPGGARVASYCSQFGGNASHRVSDNIVGTEGTCDPSGTITGKKPWKFEAETRDPTLQEHADLVASIRSGNPLNEGKRIAESSLTAIMGRMSAYTGREISWNWVLASSKLSLVPEKLEFGPAPPAEVAIPGKTPLVAGEETDPSPPKAKTAGKKAAKK
ncbi:MAG: Gfo/Idh/MocA family oxidoreductase [Planctomycetes bacterium]|nr:Gfo/Idh/MocA family oxidoreductase [Planctomycetota bacterium]